MINQAEYIAQLIKKLYDDSITEKEKIDLNKWIDQNPKRKLFIEELNQNDHLFEDALQWIELEQTDEEKESWNERLSNRTFEKIHELESQSIVTTQRKTTWIWYAAASILIGITFSFFLIQYQLEESKRQNIIALNHISPGKYQATLTLPNGDQIALSERHDLLKIGKNKQLSYASGEEIISLNKQFDVEDKLTITTPRAGHYKVELEDGSLVWLNSESSFSFPITFKENREVSLLGEGFFQVKSHISKSHNKRPFRVKTANQIVEVTGTQFNVYAFPSEETRTTLVEGKVNIHTANHSLSLLPNEQSFISNGQVHKSKIDVATEIAWRDNMFYFDETSLQSAMKQLGRWYDLEIEYKEDIPDTYFYGKFSRDQPLHDLLKILEEAGVKFEFELKNKKNYLIVLPQTTKN